MNWLTRVSIAGRTGASPDAMSGMSSWAPMWGFHSPFALPVISMRAVAAGGLSLSAPAHNEKASRSSARPAEAVGESRTAFLAAHLAERLLLVLE